MNVVFDCETYPNCFTLAAEHVDYPLTWSFEISEWRDDSAAIIEFIDSCRRMVGFNNVGFDYPVLHMLYQMRKATPLQLYEKAQAIINSQDTNRWTHMVYPSDRHAEQLDLYLIHHFDNVARATGLKALEINMRLPTVEDLPFPIGTILNREQIDLLKKYNAYDVTATKAFYHKSLPMIRFREELTKKYNRDFMNHNDTKIGKDYFAMQLEIAGVQLYNYGPEGRTPIQTPRPQIALNDAILPWVKFQHPEFQRVLDWMRGQVITQTKGALKDITTTVNGFEFVFGTGGIHGSVENRIIEADDEWCIIDLDVSSYYPNLAIKNRFAPEHLGDTFCDIYADLYEQRKAHPKGSAENAMLKLALNGTFGDSNNKFSIFYDPIFTMKITLNGQLLLCLLAEQLMMIDGLQLIQINTDGATVRVRRKDEDKVAAVRQWWESATQLQLEEARYTRMFIRDVNNYAAEGSKGNKLKGAYEYDRDWHQNHSALVVPKVAEQVLLYNAPIGESIRTRKDIFDFCLKVKVPRSSHLLADEKTIQGTTRYYVAIGGVELIKVMPPLADKTEWRRFQVEAGRKVCVCNSMADAVLPIDYAYYEAEVEKLTLALR